MGRGNARDTVDLPRGNAARGVETPRGKSEHGRKGGREGEGARSKGGEEREMMGCFTAQPSASDTAPSCANETGAKSNASAPTIAPAVTYT